MIIGKLELVEDFDGLLKGDRGTVHVGYGPTGQPLNSGRKVLVIFPQVSHGFYDLDVILKVSKPISAEIIKMAAELLGEHD